MAETVYILLGSNIGDREAFLEAARNRIATVQGMEITAASALYASKAQDMDSENPPFLNQVIRAEYQYTPGELLRTLEQIERDLGRTGKGRCRPRTIDLDVLLLGDRIVETELLTIPHPRLLSRSFALVPLLQIDPALVYPGSGRPLAGYITKDACEQVTVFKEHAAGSI